LKTPDETPAIVVKNKPDAVDLYQILYLTAANTSMLFVQFLVLPQDFVHKRRTLQNPDKTPPAWETAM